MKRLYAVLLVAVCLVIAVTLVAEEKKEKKGKWYDIFRGPPTLASQELQLRQEEFELYKKMGLSPNEGGHPRTHAEIHRQIGEFLHNFRGLSIEQDKVILASGDAILKIEKRLDSSADLFEVLYNKILALESHANKCGVHAATCPYASRE